MKPTSLLLRRALVWTTMAVIILLLVFQYLRNRSLWLDEAMLAWSVISKNPLQLFKPLDYSQVAPILFLLIEKLFTSIFGNNDMALRIFPLLCAILTLPLFYDFGSALTRNRTIGFLALCLLGCTPKFIYYSSEMKQYACDMFVLCAIYFAAFSESSFAVRNRKVLLAVTGAIAVFLSNVSVIPLAIVGGLLFYQCVRNKNDREIYTLPLVVWVACIGVNFFAFVNNNPTAQVMRAYWQDYFMPYPWHAGFKDWLVTRGTDVFSGLLPTSGPSLFWPHIPIPYLLGMILYGGSIVYLLLSRRFRLLYLCVGPVVLHLLLSALKLYPFDLRLILYMLPLFLLVMATGLFALCNFLFQWAPAVLRYAVAVLCVVVFFAWNAYYNYPFLSSGEDIKPVLTVMNQNMQDGYNVYVYFGARPAYRYYREIGYARFGGAKIVMGENHTGDPEGYLTEMRSLKGPTWFLISHGSTQEEEQYILKGLAIRGPKLKEFIGYGSRAYLFDLK
ncbi:glycosyltransferase family 39 protein [Puia dinghuensis]|uniref:Glycosyltransferase RgtA/B/C/D-like domain-containing protein n=1 Tax=Puia dinghuensis TaxID=1792502 RepID=A0A8J2UEP3_9BACT|nr:glycosyltransferase family 39 protein [Puia dinghuensis]GGB06393.1 hypothetical protein GCM10011511_32270 [Puia dinghuensis]